jgi:hypothetical protein
LRVKRHLGLAVLTALLTLGSGSALADARGRHKVPDLRQASTLHTRSGYRQIELPLTIHVATSRGHWVVSRARVVDWVKRANEALRPYGLRVTIRSVTPMAADYSHITRWRHRRALARLSPSDGTVHVFAVDRLELFAIGRADRAIRGMHWRYRGLLPKLANREYVVVTSDAPRTTFVHELGHLFGLRHVDSRVNLMCTSRSGPNQRFGREQGERMRRGAQRFLARQGREPGGWSRREPGGWSGR